MEDDVGDITLEQIIPDAIGGNREALDLLIVHRWTVRILDKVSGWAEWKFKQDRSDVRQIIVFTLLVKVTSISNPSGRPWHLCLKSWFYTIARNHCLNEITHEGVVDAHRDSCASENEHGTLKSVGGGTIAIQSSTMASQEQELLEKEQMAQVREALRKVIISFPRHEEIVRLWWQRKSVNEIAEITGKSVKTIYPILKKIEKALTKELGIKPLEGKDKILP